MPLQTTTPSLQNTLRNRLQDPFSEEERKKMLGNNTALQSQLDSLSGSLGAFDPSAERGARTGLLEQQAQQARENIARTFALDPSGIKTGAAIRPFSAIEGARLSNLAALESELSQRAGAENRANLGALQSLQGQQQGLNLNAAQLGLQGLGQLQNQVQFDASQALQNEQFGRQLGEQGRQFDASQLGQIGGVDTLAARQLASQIGLGNRAQALAEQGQQAQIGLQTRAQTLAEQGQQAQIGLQTRAQDLQEQVSLGNLSLAEADQILRSDIQRGQLGLSAQQLAQQGTQFERSLAEQAAAREAANRLSEGQLLGNLGGQDTLASQQLQSQLGLDTQQLELQRQALAEQTAARQEANALQRLGLTGTEGGTQTIALQQLRQQDAQFDAQMSQRASEFARQYGLQEAELFGGGPSITFSVDEITGQRLGAKDGDRDYRPEFDVDGNGVYEFNDFIKIAGSSADLGNGVMQFIPDEGRRTLAQQQFDVASANASREFGIEEARLAEATRQFDQQFAQAKNEFNSTMSGLVFNDDGTIKHKWGINENGMPVPVPVSTLEREQFAEQKRQFNEKLNFDIEALAEQLDIDLKKIDANKFAALMGLVGSIANTAGTVIGNQGNRTGTQQNFTTVNSNSPGFSVGFGTNGFSFG